MITEKYPKNLKEMWRNNVNMMKIYGNLIGDYDTSRDMI